MVAGQLADIPHPKQMTPGPMVRAGLLQNSYIIPAKNIILDTALSTLGETTPCKDGKDEEGEGPPLVQGGEGQGAQEGVRAIWEATRPPKEGSRGGKTSVRPNWIAKREAQEGERIRCSFADQDFCCPAQSMTEEGNA